MSRARHILSLLRPGRRHDAADGGFSLIEVIVALGLLVAVMATTAGFFTTSLKQSNGQTQAQQAAVLADQQLDYTRSVTGDALLSGRTSTAVAAAIASPPVGVDLSQDVTGSGNFDSSATGTSTQAVPITMTPTVGGTKYTITTFIDRCYLTAVSAPDCKSTVTSYGWLYRITVDVTYSLGGGRACANNKPCYYVVSTLRDKSSNPCFNVNVSFAGCSISQPTITSISPNTVTTNSSTTITLMGTNFDPGASVSLDTGGTASSVTVNSSTNLTFTLTTDNTPAAVGARTVKVTNPNGKFAYGTMTISTTAINVSSVTPSPIYTSATSTLTISGSGFQSGSVVSIPSAAGTIVGTPTITATTITLSFAAGSSASAVGTWPATVTNPDGNSASANFSVRSSPITVTSVSPSTSLSGSVNTFTISGTGFAAGATVKLDNTAVSTSSITSTAISLTLTSPAAGSHTFTVTNPDGGYATGTFSVTSAGPTITNVNPDSAGRYTTKTFTVSGTGFIAGSSNVTVYLTGAVTKTISYQTASSTQLSFNYRTPYYAGTYQINVRLKFGNGSYSNTYAWTLVTS